jgi:hypothetical protein
MIGVSLMGSNIGAVATLKLLHTMWINHFDKVDANIYQIIGVGRL